MQYCAKGMVRWYEGGSDDGCNIHTEARNAIFAMWGIMAFFGAFT